MGVKSAVKALLTGRLDREYEKRLREKKADYDSWVRERERAASLGEDRTASGAGSSESRAVLILQKRGSLAETALRKIEDYFRRHPECEVLYGDEDAAGPDGIRRNPWYRPCWSPDLYLDCFYPGSVIAVRPSAARRHFAGLLLEEEGSRVLYEEPSQIRPGLDALLEETGAFEKGCVSVQRLPEILFHAEDESVWETYLACPAGEGLFGHLAERAGNFGEGSLSVIIPSKDNPQTLEKCLAALKKALGKDSEIIVVDNGSSPRNREAIEKLLQGETYLYRPMEFNFSSMCNLGAERARGNYLLFLNDDVELCDDGCLEKMCAKAALPYVGAVGIKLRYPDDLRIQHDGITNLLAGPVHKMQFFEDNRSYYFGRNRFSHNCLAVTAACLMIARRKFDEAGGFDSRLKVAYNDVELGFRLWEAGYRNVVLNNCRGLHFESLSRGSDETPEKQRRLEEERELLYRLHPAFLGTDPCYPEQLNVEGLDSRILPGYITSRNTVQRPAWRVSAQGPEEWRQDECLMVRIETAGPDRIQGYSVVLGDDNACYDRYLFLEKEDGAGERFCMKLEGQYRDDLETNLPDQRNVALGGFRVSREGERLAPGSYRIGILAVHRIGGLKLFHWAGRCLRVRERDNADAAAT